MTRQDFIAIAAALNRARLPEQTVPAIQANLALNRAAYDIAQHCAHRNPLFSRSQFLAAAGVPS